MDADPTIESRIAEFLATDDPKLAWVKPAVRKHGFLPLYVGWVATLGIRSDGSFVRWDHDSDPEQVTPLLMPYWKRMALVQGSKRYPELRALIPTRPIAAETCSVCGGPGTLPSMSEMICECGGVGWVIPGEQKEPFSIG